MKRFLASVAMVALVVLVGCSGDSPKPGPLPTPSTDVWEITQLQASPSSPDVREVVVITATVTKNGSPAPDGTGVEFLSGRGTLLGSSGGTLSCGGHCTVATESGRASIGFTACVDTNSNGSYELNECPADTYVIQAKVRAVTRSLSVTFSGGVPSELSNLEIYLPLIPREGSRFGGEEVMLNGKGIHREVEVAFKVKNLAGDEATYPAEVLQVSESHPSSGLGAIRIRVPAIANILGPTDLDKDVMADVIVRRAVGTTAEQEVTLTAAFKFVAEEVPPETYNYGALQIFLPLVPDHGSRFGGEQVVLSGKGIAEPAEVYFKVDGNEYQAVTVSVVPSNPPDALGTITISTPPITGISHDPEDLAKDFLADVRVTTPCDPANPDTPDCEATSPRQEKTYIQAFTFDKVESGGGELEVILPLVPNEGSRKGGEAVTVNAKGVVAPAAVYFIVEGIEYPSRTTSVTPDQELGGVGQIVIETLAISGILNEADLALAFPADVRVEVGSVEGGDYQSRTYPAAFTFTPEEGGTGPGVVSVPEIYSVVPSHGSARGGEMVTIFGRDFDYGLNGHSTVKVEFLTGTYGDLPGIDPVVSSDGHQIVVTTPQVTATMLIADLVADVRVTNLHGEPPEDFVATKQSAFIFDADLVTPVITGIAPTSGPIDGGTVVTIFGTGFQIPVQVYFGTLEAIVNSVNDTEIVCVTPNASQIPDITPPATVDVIVKNLNSGFMDTLTGGFMYGLNLFISGNTPSQGLPGTEVRIFGTGFEDPLTVEFLGLTPALRLEEQAISGTEIVVRFPSDAAPVCEDVTGSFRVTLIERPYVLGEGFVEGGEFTYLGLTPIVTSVDPPIVQETMGGWEVTPSTITIHGMHFTENVLVAFDHPDSTAPLVMDSADVERVSDTEIVVTNVPGPNDFNLPDSFFNRSECVTIDGAAGFRFVPTAVDVTVTNIPGDCSDTLVGGLIIEPEDTECHAAPVANFTGPAGQACGSRIDFPDTAGPAPPGACSAPMAFTIANSGAGPLDIVSVSIVGTGFYFTDMTQSMAGFSIPAFSNQVLDVIFCPDLDNGALYTGTLAIFHLATAPASPCTFLLQGQEIRNIFLTTAPYANGDLWTFPQTAAGLCSPVEVLTITNDVNSQGDAALSGTISSGWTGTLASATPLPPGASTTMNVQFCPTVNNNALQTGTLTIIGTGPDTPSGDATVTINVEGQEDPILP